MNHVYSVLDMLELEGLQEALRSLGAVLESRHLSYRLLVVGGGTMLLLGFTDRPTGDVDVAGINSGRLYLRADPLPQPLIVAVADVGRALGLDASWLNPGPTSLLDLGLPAGLEERVTVRRYGGLELHLPGREDLICFKLYAAVDQGPRSKHFQDLQAFDPTSEELLSAARWTVSHDPSQGFRGELREALSALGVEVTDADF